MTGEDACVMIARCAEHQDGESWVQARENTPQDHEDWRWISERSTLQENLPDPPAIAYASEVLP